MLRQATSTEIAFYENALYPLQDQIFPLIQTDQVYLTGGTCLSRFYYQHRFSDDLDFFFDGSRFSQDAFNVTIREIANRISTGFDIEMTVNGEFFKRFFVRHQQQSLKIQFIYENFKTVGTLIERRGILIDSKENIATNKLTAVYDRKTVKDWVDLYFLLQELSFETLAEWTKHKIVPLDYEGVVLTFQDRHLEGEVLLRRPLSESEFTRFVNDLIARMFTYAKRTA